MITYLSHQLYNVKARTVAHDFVSIACCWVRQNSFSIKIQLVLLKQPNPLCSLLIQTWKILSIYCIVMCITFHNYSHSIY